MDKTEIPPANGGTRAQTIGSIVYRADRIWLDDNLGSGAIELREPESGQPVARITYQGATDDMVVETFAGPIPWQTMVWLFDEANRSLA